MKPSFLNTGASASYHVARLGSFKNARKYEVVSSLARDRGVTALFDVGCGTGPLLVLAEQDGYFSDIQGCEPSAHLLEAARKTLQRAEIWAGSFDTAILPPHPCVIVLNDVLHHIEDKPSALTKLRGYLACTPGSCAVIFEPNCYNPVTFFHQLRDDGIRLSLPFAQKRLLREAGIRFNARFMCAGRDAPEQSTAARLLEGSLLSGVFCMMIAEV